MSIDTNDSDLGLAHLDPVDPPADVWDAAVAVAVDPTTPAPEDDLLPDPDSLDPAPEEDVSALADDGEIDLSDFDDDLDSTDSMTTDDGIDMDPAAPGSTDPFDEELSAGLDDSAAPVVPGAYDDVADEQFDYGTDGATDGSSALGGFEDAPDGL